MTPKWGRSDGAPSIGAVYRGQTSQKPVVRAGLV
ncbi:MAG: hypothetical protein K0R27_4618 [Xanthobacteraceae bacterium]|nr:hypothetical protein [Xanthobacteraceae bacterium]